MRCFPTEVKINFQPLNPKKIYVFKRRTPIHNET